MTKLISKLHKKSIAIFISALFVGLYAGGFFDGYVFNFKLEKKFTVSEVKELNGKKVLENCYKNSTKKEKAGKVIGYSVSNYASAFVRIKWDNEDSVLYSDYPKSYFSKCIEVAE